MQSQKNVFCFLGLAAEQRIESPLLFSFDCGHSVFPLSTHRAFNAPRRESGPNQLKKGKIPTGVSYVGFRGTPALTYPSFFYLSRMQRNLKKNKKFSTICNTNLTLLSFPEVGSV